MKLRNSIFLSIFLIVTLLSSCTGLVGGRRSYYMQQNLGSPAGPDEPSVAPPPPSVSTAQDPFLFPENNIVDAGGFTAADMDSWTLASYFDKRNVALHSFIIDGSKMWTEGDATKGEYLLTGQETYTEVVSGNMGKIKDVTYTMYKGKNDHFFPDDPYNITPINDVVRMERFRFYRFFGTPASGPKLDNRLMVIDSMTKLIFAYSKPVKFQNVVGQNVPIGWEAVETATVISGKTRPFYEYDPIGVLHKDGTVEFFDTYVNNTAAAKYDPVIGDPSREVASSGKPGRSPYYVVDAQEAAGSFLENVKGKEFKTRQQSGSSEYLHTYRFSEDGNILYHELTKWRGELQVMSSQNFSNALSDKIALFGEKKMRLSDDLSVLYIDDVNVGSTNYEDKGPFFPDRVKGLIYEGSDYIYTFSADGRSVSFTGKTSGNYTLTRDEKYRATYDNWGIQLYTENNTQDDTIKWSETPGLHTDVITRADFNPAYLQASTVPENPEEVFLNSIRNKTYFYRCETSGLSDILEIASVSSDGKNITLSKREWRKYSNITTKTFMYTQNVDMSASLYGSDTVTQANNGSVLSLDGKQFKVEYNDVGPKFVDRVKGSSFSGSGYTYSFSSDGTSIAVTGKADTTYTLVGTDNNSYAEYKESFSIFGLIPSTRYWGVKIETDGSVVDSVIRWTPTPMLTENTHVLPGTASSNPAWLNGFESDVDSLTTEEKFLYGLSGKNYRYRSTTEGTSDILETYIFANDGRSATKETQMWRTLEKTRIDGLMLKEINSEATGVFNIIDISESEVNGEAVIIGELTITLSNSGNDAVFSREAKKTYSANFTDPGPQFVDRVKGQTFKGSKYTYIFSEDGKRIEGSNTYNVSGYGDLGNTHYDFRVYKMETSALLKHYGFRLYSEGGGIDNILRLTTKQGGSGIPLRDLADNYGATLVQ